MSDISKGLAVILGLTALGLCGATFLLSEPADSLAQEMYELVGGAFLLGLGALVLVAAVASVRIWRDPEDRKCLAAGLQASSGVATLALTFTLLGISLGIGELAEQELTPETVRIVIQGLTERFSLAFMTTVIGLPMAAVLRAILTVLAARSVAKKPSTKGEFQ